MPPPWPACSWPRGRAARWPCRTRPAASVDERSSRRASCRVAIAERICLREGDEQLLDVVAGVLERRLRPIERALVWFLLRAPVGESEPLQRDALADLFALGQALGQGDCTIEVAIAVSGADDVAGIVDGETLILV